jgi:hypothetical protein
MEIEDKGEIKHALDMHIRRDVKKGILQVTQETYAQNMLSTFGLNDTEGKDTPAPTDDITEEDIPTREEDIKEAQKLPIRSAIGKLWWLALMTRPDIICALHKCAKWQNKPSQKLWKHIVWLMKYIKNTYTLGLVYNNKRKGNIVAYCDASFAGETNSKSRYGYVFYVNGCCVSWTSHTSTRVLTSSTESECHALVHAAKENIWIRDVLLQMRIYEQLPTTVIYEDNKTEASHV